MLISLRRAALAPRRVAVLLAGVLIALCTLTGTARADPNTYCQAINNTTNGTTTYTGPSGGQWGTGDNWSNGQPAGNCDAIIPANTTVTLSTATGPGTYGNFDSGSAAGLTVDSGATLIVQGVSSTVEGNASNATNLSVGVDGLTIASGATVDLDATAGTSPTSTSGETPGGSANLTVDSSTSTPAPLVNNGAIIASSSDSAWGESLGVGGTVTNAGSVTDQSGLLTFQGQGNLPYVFDNPGTMTVASGASFTMAAGDGSSFTNTGTFADNGSTTLQGSMHWVQSAGAVTGDPVQLTNGETLVDSAGTGPFEVDNCTTDGLTGTIPAGQTITVLGGCSGTTLYMNPPSVTNDGTIDLLAPATGGNDGIVNGSELDNDGTINATVSAAGSDDQMLAPLVNEAGGAVSLTGGELSQSAGTATSNLGTVTLGPGSTWLIQGGTFTNSATINTQIAGATSLGQFNTTAAGNFIAGGTLSPSLVSGYTPTAGTEFPFALMNGGSVKGSFGSVTGGFTPDYASEAATPGFLGLIYGAATGASTTPTPTTTTTTPTKTTTPAPKPATPSIAKESGGAGQFTLKLTCTASAKICASYKVTGTVTEHLKNKKLSSITAIITPAKTKAKPKLTTKVVTVTVTKSGTLKPGKSVALTVKLNAAGTALLKRFHTLKVQVVITSGGKTVSKKTVTITTPKPKKKTVTKKG